MAYKAFGTGDNETRKLWSSQVEMKAEQKSVFHYGSDISEEEGEAPFRRKMDLEEEADRGDRIRMTAIAPLVGDGVTGDTVIQGKGEALVTDTQDVIIDQIRHEVESPGKMGQKRVVIDFRKVARNALGQWHARKWDDARILTICGTLGLGAATLGGTLKWTQASLNSFAGLNLVAPDASHLVFANGRANDGALGSTDTMSAKVISLAKKQATKLDTPVTPLIVDGDEKFVMYVSTGQAFALKYDQDWREAQKFANIRGSKNPLFSGMLGEYDGVIVKVIPRMVQVIANVTRAVLMGADDVFEAFGLPENGEDSPYSWNEEVWDRRSRKVVTVGSIGGMRKNTFSNAWLNSVAVDTWDAG